MTAKPRYRVVTMLQKPFTMYDKSTGLWSGFCIDLVKELQSILNFTYEIREPYDKNYGFLNVTTMQWNGMIRELVDGTADIAVAPMWMTRIRAMAVDFTEPFYPRNGISCVMRDNRRKVPFLRFLTILESEIWLSFFGVFLLTSLLLYFLEQFSPYSYKNANKKKKRKDKAELRFCHVKDCFWYVLTSLLAGGGDVMPKNLSGKLCTITWWLFGFIIASAYTANLAAYQMLIRMEKRVETLYDLGRQYHIEYSTIYESSTYKYFSNMVEAEKVIYEKWKSASFNESETPWERLKSSVWDYPFDDTYTKMLVAMNSSGFPRTEEEAVARIRGINQAEPFAFVTEEVTVRYLVLTTCDLVPVGEPIAKRPYSIAVRLGSPLKSELNFALRKLYAEIRMERLMRKWWDENPARILCGSRTGPNEGIGMDYMAAVFSLILLGTALAFAILSLQYWWYYYVPRSVLKNTKRTIVVANVPAKDIDPSWTSSSR